MVVHKFSTSPFEATCFKVPLHSCNISFYRKVFLQGRFDCEQIRNATNGEYLEALNVMYCNKVLL